MVLMRDKAKGVCRMSGDAGAFPECKVITDDIRSHRRPEAQLWVGSSWNYSVFLERPYHGTPREGSGSLCMQPVGYTPMCSTSVVVCYCLFMSLMLFL